MQDKMDKADRLFRAGRQQPAGMQDMAGMQAEQPELAEEEASHPLLLPENNRILLKSIQILHLVPELQQNLVS